MSMVQKRIFGRDEYLGVFGLDTNAFSARTHRSETALAFGLSKPAFQNSYGEFDLVAGMLTFFIVNLVQIDLAAAAELVRMAWRAWLWGIAKTEHLPPGAPYSEQFCFVVAKDVNRKSIEDIEVGLCQEIIDEITARDSNLVPIPVPLDMVLRQLRKQAGKRKLILPKPLTPNPDPSDSSEVGEMKIKGRPVSKAYEAWVREIEDYREFAIARGGRASRVKKRKVKATA